MSRFGNIRLEDLIIDIDFNEFERRIMNNEMIHAESRKDGNVKYDLLISTAEVDCISTTLYHEGKEVINIGKLYEGSEELDYFLKKIYNTMKDDNFVDVPEYVSKRARHIGLLDLVLNPSVSFSEFEKLLRQMPLPYNTTPSGEPSLFLRSTMEPVYLNTYPMGMSYYTGRAISICDYKGKTIGYDSVLYLSDPDKYDEDREKLNRKLYELLKDEKPCQRI